MFKSKFKYVSITLIVVALSLSAFFIINKNKENANAQVDNPIGQVTKPKATTSTTTTISTLPALPQPLDSPADPNAKVPVVQIGSIEIPKLSMKV